MTTIGVLTTEYPPDKGGVGRFMTQIVSCLPNDTTMVFTPVAAGRKQENYRIKQYTFSKNIWPRWIPLFWDIAFRKKDLRSFIVSSVLPLGTITWLLSFIRPVRYTVVIHGMDIAQLRPHSWKRWLATRILSRAFAIIVNSSFTKQILKQFTHTANNVYIVHPRPYCTPEFSTSRKPVTLPEDFVTKKMFVSVGRLVPRKNFLRLLDIAKTLDHSSAFRLVIVGNGPDANLLKDKIKAIPNACLLTEISDDELAWLYTHCRAVLFVPLSESHGDVEGFGISAIEASAFSKPVIGSTEGGVPDAVADHISGVLVNPRNSVEIQKHIMHLLENDDLVRKLGTQGRRRIDRQFTHHKQCSLVYSSIGLNSRAPISVIIPAYQAEHTIARTITSLLSQTLVPKEIIVVDDGSTDRTLKVVHTFSHICRIIRQKNQGAPVARNNGATYATQPYLLFVDADIVLKPDMLETQLRALERYPDSDFAYSGFRFGWKKFQSFPFSLHRLKKHNYIHTSSLIRKASFPGFDPLLARHQDWDLWLTIAQRGGRGVYIPRILYRIILDKNRISHWVPSFAYRIPFGDRIFPEVRKYRASEKVIKQKHGE